MPEIRRMGYLLTGLMVIAALSAFIWKPAPPAKFVGLNGAQVPMNIGSFVGADFPVDSATLSEIPSADIVERHYSGPDGSVIDVTIIGGTGRNQLHDPRSCLVGAGWQIENDHVEVLPPPARVAVRSCQILKSSTLDSYTTSKASSADLMYIYVVDRKPIASASAIRWTLLKSDLLEQNDQPVYFIRTVVDQPTNDVSSTADTREHRGLAAFTAALWKAISPAIDRGESV